MATKVKRKDGTKVKIRGMIKVVCSRSDAPVWANAAPGKADGHRCTKCGETGHQPAKIK